MKNVKPMVDLTHYPEWYLKSIDDCMSRAMTALAKNLRESSPIANTEARDFYNSLDINMTPIKEAKMIDLSTAVVGDKFVLRNDYVAQLVASKPAHGMYVLDLIDDISYVVCMSDGMCVITDPNIGTGKQLMRHLDVKSKHDHRHWLGQLPDADLFVDGVNWLSCDKDESWWVGPNEPTLLTRDFEGGDEQKDASAIIKMPTLTGDEWRDSKISIDELRAWQAANK